MKVVISVCNYFQTLNMGENCPRYNKALDEVFHSPEVQKEEQKNKVKKIPKN